MSDDRFAVIIGRLRVGRVGLFFITLLLDMYLMNISFHNSDFLYDARARHVTLDNTPLQYLLEHELPLRMESSEKENYTRGQKYSSAIFLLKTSAYAVMDTVASIQIFSIIWYYIYQNYSIYD